MNDTETEIVEVSPSRLEYGYWCHDTNRQVGEGDISASYSADVIAHENRVRKPFRLHGWLRVAVGSSRIGGSDSVEAYRLVSKGAFEGEATTYGEKTIRGARKDPEGFYHGMTVKHGKQEYVLVGTPLTLIAGEPEAKQGILF